MGNLATVTDSETGIVTTYYYDLLNRQSGYREIGTGLNHSVTYEYDADNNLASMTETLNGTTTTYTYTYDDDNRIVSETVDGVTVSYTYDGFGRLESRIVKRGDTVIYSSTPTYSAGAEAGTTTGQISSYNGYTYTYDDNGNILTVSDGTNTTSYVYDSANQLVRENNQAKNYTKVWTYDAAGNIQSRTEYTYTTAASLDSITPTDTVNYGYNDTQWKDLLTSYDGNTITYDEIGNPLSDGEWTYTWQHGRQLASMSKGTATWTYTYDSNGLRTKKTDGSHTYTYVYSGSLLTSMSTGSYTLYFTYDASGTPLTITIGSLTYYYVTNLQGDVIGILDSYGLQVVSYAYDTWGNVTILDQCDPIVDYNPLLYRGYVYDDETGLYYLQSRYYNPRWGRFINADGLVSTGQGLLGNNMFAYCMNNPVNMYDSTGEWPKWIKKAANWINKNIIQPVVEIVEEAIDLITPPFIDAIIDYLTPPSKEDHYNRNQYNFKYTESLTEEDLIEWDDSVSAKCHQFSAPNKDNVKYVSPDGYYEVIFDANGKVVTDPRDIGTYNFVSPKEDSFGHFIKDVFPWILYGNSPDDSTKWWQRAYYYFLY